MKRPLQLPSKKLRERVESKALWNEARSLEQADFYTIGYEGRTTDELIAVLAAAQVRTLIDIRFTPLSIYRPDLSKRNLEKRVHNAGMIYLHARRCGVPKDIRANVLATGDRNSIWDWYDRHVVDQLFRSNLHWFLNLEHPIAMMCVEHDPAECHRHRIFLALEENGLQGFDL